MNDLETQSSPEAEAAAKKADRGQSPLKLIAGLVFMMASVGVLIHSVPRHKYVEVHADKPRPRPAAKAEEAEAPRPQQAKPQPPKPASAPGGRGLKSPVAPAAAQTSLGAGGSASDADAVEDWRDACAAEVGILCNGVTPGRQPRCLRSYEDVIRKDCQKALLILSGAGPGSGPGR